MSLLTKLIVPAFVLASSFHMDAQIKNAQTIIVRVSGNCGMCEATIEKAGNIKKEAIVEWDKDKQTATISYNLQKTNADQILKRIALAGYDNEKYLAPYEAYNSLQGCCQYERSSLAGKKELKDAHSAYSAAVSGAHNTAATGETRASNALAPVFASYFSLQEALVKSDVTRTASAAGELQKAIVDVPMSDLGIEAHNIWMEINEKSASDAKAIAASKDLNKQKVLFAGLSDTMYALAKVADLQQIMYYNNCPMFNDGKGANWLSDEKGIRNPYYGSQMLTCGKTIETIE